MTISLLDRGLAYISPGLALSLHRWRQRRARDRQKLDRVRDGKQFAITEPMPDPEPRDVRDVFIRMRGQRRPDWCAYGDSLEADKRALHHRLGTNARTNLMSRFR
jgi:hypothetical protein